MQELTVGLKERVARITLNRPEKRNALSPKLIEELSQTFDSLLENPSVKVIVINGAGNVFCAGADLSYIREMQYFTYEENLEDSRRLARLYYKIYTSDKITIAQTHGFAVAGGAGLATVCDYIYSSEDCKFGYPEVKIGFVPAMVSVFLKRKITGNHANGLLLSGKMIDAQSALKIGLIHKVFPEDELDEAVFQRAHDLTNSVSSESIIATKKALLGGEEDLIKKQLDLAAAINAKSRETQDCKKGIKNFFEKRQFDW